MATRIIGDLLLATEELKSLSARTRRLRELQKLYFRSAPRELAGSSRVKSYRAGVLCVTADNGVVAAKLKQLAPSLLAAIRKGDGDITAIRIDVQVRGIRTPGQLRKTKKSLSDKVLSDFDALAGEVADEGLKSALANLVRHHRQTRG